jgi:hypothetical protein
MEILILDNNFIEIGVLENFDSVIWSDRFYQCGDFEIHTKMNSNFLNMIQKGYYLCLEESEHLMAVETREIKSDVEEGDTLIITGRSIESFLDRRIVWSQTILSGNLQTAVQTILNNNAINPVDTSRTIPNLVFLPSTDSAITSLTISAQYTGDYVLDVITAICQSQNIGFKITLNTSKQLVFSLYSGTDRSYNQSVNPYVVFSPGYENMVRSDYTETDRYKKTVCLIAGEGVGSSRITTTTSSSTAVGLERREMYADAKDLSKTTSGGTLTDAAYLAQLVERGNENLAANVSEETFEGEIDSSSSFQYNSDFFMGDIIQNEDNYGNQSRSRVTEFVYSQDSTGLRTYPTFTTVS